MIFESFVPFYFPSQFPQQIKSFLSLVFTDNINTCKDGLLSVEIYFWVICVITPNNVGGINFHKLLN